MLIKSHKKKEIKNKLVWDRLIKADQTFKERQLELWNWEHSADARLEKIKSEIESEREKKKKKEEFWE